MWRNFKFICMTDVEKSDISTHVELFQISPHERSGEIWNFSTSGMCMMWRMSLYMYTLGCFVAKSVLSRFTHFCVEKNWTKECVCGEKMTNMRYGYGAAGIAVILITYFFSRMRLKLVVVLMLTPVLIFITVSMMRMMLKIFSAGSCRLKRRCGSRVLGEVYSLPPLPPSHGPRSCHGSSPGGTAPRAVSALLGGQFVSTWVTVGQLCFLVVDGEKWFPAAAVMALHTTVGLGDFILMPEITMDNFVSNLKKRWVETTFSSWPFDLTVKAIQSLLLEQT